ncbi:RpiR family transcriptional regulator [Azorhizobium oxalatiphilum]|uniref:RpiR family transcriptional regulator n=1 Tax=Azorhizobium oxalatiphilum TaxID=980631 RepID=A0A917BW27_9HYPH|nr:MurR/RpiR family transcriptional regulator [Azorhizobium oxalatiphilum]GGF59108.1 RpiR family transcriptional regulator [Azorhizobium oxalatiphilum]
MTAISLLDLIRSHRTGMTPQHGRVADFVLRHPLQAATMGIEELAAAADVSVATINRFVRGLGLDGFAQFRALGVASFRPLSPVEKLEAQASASKKDGDVVAGTLEAVVANLRVARSVVDASVFRRAAEAITAADRVVFMGLGLSAPLVALLADMILPFCRAQLILDGQGGQERMIRRAFHVGQGDVVIAMALPRYSQATIDHVRTIRAQGARVIGITDALTSPLALHADLLLLGAAEHPLLHASPTACVALFEVLTAVLTARRTSAGDAAELTRRIAPHLHSLPEETPAERATS